MSFPDGNLSLHVRNIISNLVVTEGEVGEPSMLFFSGSRRTTCVQSCLVCLFKIYFAGAPIPDLLNQTLRG